MDNGAEWYRRFLDGDEDALTEIIKIYRPGLRAYLTGIVGDIYLADDITQETFIKLCVKKPKDKGGGSFKTWLYTIGRNIAIDWLRKQSKERCVPLEDVFEPAAPYPSPEDEALRAEENAALLSALSGLAPQYRQVIYLSYFSGFDVAQISKILKKSNRTVSLLLYRAKAALKTEYERRTQK